jgi:hypothetical protein
MKKSKQRQQNPRLGTVLAVAAIAGVVVVGVLVYSFERVKAIG